MKHIQNIGPHLSELLEFRREIGDGFEIGDIQKRAQLLNHRARQIHIVRAHTQRLRAR